MKKLISMALALCLALSVVVIPAAAAEGNEVPEALKNSPTFGAAYEYVYGNDIYLVDEIEGDAVEYMKGAVTRGEYAVYLARFAKADLSAYEGEVAYPDMAGQDAEVMAAVAWGKANGYIKGYKSGNYQPAKEVTREEICALFARYERVNGWQGLTATDNITYFVDEADFSEYTKEEGNIVDCVKYGLIQGKADGTFGAGDIPTNRAHMAAILYRTTAPLNTTKFYLAVESGEGYVSARVNEHYTMVVTVADAAVDPSTITLKAEMNNVASLGVEGTRTHETTINTNIASDGSADLKVWLENCWNFAGTTINIDVAGEECVYNVQATKVVDGDAVIVFMPADTTATRAAWAKLAEAVGTETQAADDSYVTIANGSYLQLGTEKLEFEALEGDLKLDNFSDMDALEAEIRSKVVLNTEGEAAVEGMLAAGTELAVGSSVAVLEKDVTVAVEGITVDGLLGDMKDATGTYAMAKALVSTVNALVGGMGTEVNVTVTID